MNVNVTVPSAEIVAACQQKLERIRLKRIALRDKAVAERVWKPTRLGRLFGAKGKTYEEAEQEVAAIEREKSGHTGWQTTFSEAEACCRILIRMAAYENQLVLDVDAFSAAGLAYSKDS